jgi:hypothetical protein
MQVAQAMLDLSLATDLDNLAKPPRERAHRSLASTAIAARASALAHAARANGENDQDGDDDGDAGDLSMKGSIEAVKFNSGSDRKVGEVSVAACEAALATLVDMATVQQTDDGGYVFDQDVAVHAVRRHSPAPSAALHLQIASSVAWLSRLNVAGTMCLAARLRMALCQRAAAQKQTCVWHPVWVCLRCRKVIDWTSSYVQRQQLTVAGYMKARFGAHGHRIWRLLLECPHLPLDAVAKQALLELREARQHVYSLFQRGYVLVQARAGSAVHAGLAGCCTLLQAMLAKQRKHAALASEQVLHFQHETLGKDPDMQAVLVSRDCVSCRRCPSPQSARRVARFISTAPRLPPRTASLSWTPAPPQVRHCVSRCFANRTLLSAYDCVLLGSRGPVLNFVCVRSRGATSFASGML